MVMVLSLAYGMVALVVTASASQTTFRLLRGEQPVLYAGKMGKQSAQR
ncbi:hypothetical protein CWS02_16205 [Enterobacter sp. EA-1]|nr:hypothetical protein CWS02_16205 [Enterobacter sp. EA-1]